MASGSQVNFLHCSELLLMHTLLCFTFTNTEVFLSCSCCWFAVNMTNLWCRVFHLRRRLHKLGVSKITQVDFLPREVVSYSKETQTPLATHQSEGKIFFSLNMLKNVIKIIVSHSIAAYHVFSASQLLFMWLMAVLMRIIIKITLNAGGTKLFLTYNGLCLDSSLMGTF